MGKKGKVRLNWAPRVKQPSRPVRCTHHTPYDEEIFGPPISYQELMARLVHKKAY